MNDVHTEPELAGREVDDFPLDSLDLGATRARVMQQMFEVSQPTLYVDRFEIVGRIGEGAMGRVYRAVDRTLDRQVAIKMIAQSGVSQRLRERILAEARALAQLSHPNVVKIYDVLVLEDDQVLLVMELIEGSTLREWFHRERPSPEAVLGAMAQAARGVAAAHDVGIVHGDIKPDNILRDEQGRVWVADFGLAHEQRDSTVTGDVLVDTKATTSGSGSSTGRDSSVPPHGGTPAYMAPAQLRGAEADVASDQYSLCVTLFEGLYGQRPYPDPDIAGAWKARKDAPTLPSDGPRISSAHARALLRGLSPRVELRHRSVAALADVWSRRAPTRRRQVGVVLGVGAIVALAAVAMSSPPEATPAVCEDGAQRIANTWEQGRAQVMAAIEDTAGKTLAGATGRELEGYTERWGEAYRASCAMQAEPEFFDRAMGCLREQHEELEAVIELLGSAESRVARRSFSVVKGLPNSDECTHPERQGAPIQPRVSRGLARAWVQFRAGRDDECLAELDALGPDISPHAQATVSFLRGHLLFESGKGDEARELLESAFWQAKSVGEIKVALRAALVLVRLEGVSHLEIELGRKWLRQAEAMIARGEFSEIWRARLQTSEAEMEQALGNFGRAQTLFESALSIVQRFGGRPLNEATLSARLGVLAKEQGHYSVAVSHFHEALVVRREFLGNEHPTTLTVLANLGSVHQGLGHVDRARELQVEALAGLRLTLGPKSPTVAGILNNLGTLESRAKNWEVALGYYDDALEVLADSRRDAVQVRGTLLLNSGKVAQKLGRIEDARARLGKARRLLEERLGPRHVDIAWVVNAQGKLEKSVGNREQAVELLGLAAPMVREGLGEDNRLSARFEGDWAKALHEVGRTKEALAAYERALAWLQAADDGDAELEAELVEARDRAKQALKKD